MAYVEPGERVVVELKPEWIFASSKGKALLKSFSNNASYVEKRKCLDDVLDVLETEYPDKEKLTPKEFRKSWRRSRIELYNTLIPLTLGAEGQEGSQWRTGEYGKFSSYLVPGSIFEYLMEHIHENDDIVFKHHLRKKPLLDKVDPFWLQESLDGYMFHFIGPIIKSLERRELGMERKLKPEVCKTFYNEAIKTFEKKWQVAGKGWRYKARMYWLLAQAKHAPISGDGVQRFKSLDYIGPVGVFLQELLTKHNEMLLEDEDGDSLIGYAKTTFPPKFDTEKQEFDLGSMKFSSLLAHASAIGDHVLVRCVMQSRAEFAKRDECDYEWDRKWKKTWADALWIAAYKGHGLVVKELLQSSELYSIAHYSEKKLPPPLHVAVHRRRISVVDAFASREDLSHISCHEEDHEFNDGQTPLEVATSLEEKSAKKKIQNILLQRKEVQQAVEESYRQREMTVNSANAIMVGAALIASVTFAGWLQPPLGYHPYYQFMESLPAPPDTPESYLFIDGHKSIRVFAICNSMSFFLAIAAIVAGMETYCFIENLEDTYISKTVRDLHYKLKQTRILFVASVTFVLVAFGSAALAILPPIPRYKTDMYVTIAVGGLACLWFIGRMLVSSLSTTMKKKLEKKEEYLKENMKKRLVNVEAKMKGTKFICYKAMSSCT